MRLIFLGTSGMVPTKDRNVSGVFLQYKDQGILFDCGEGTQRQMNIAGIKRTSITKILISHWHGDHVSGLIGLFQTIGNEKLTSKLEIFGPPGTKKRIEYLLKTCSFNLATELIIKEINAEKPLRVFEDEDYFIESALLDHKEICVGYAFVEKDKRRIDIEALRKLNIPDGPHLKTLQEGKTMVWKGKKISAKKTTYTQEGKKIAYVTDTAPCKNAILLAKDADVFICESSYASELKSKAEEHKHMTAQDAALIAQQANAEKLVLTHFSQRYETTEDLEKDAKIHFKDVVCAYDFMTITL